MAKNARRRADRARVIAARRFIVRNIFAGTWEIGAAGGGQQVFEIFPVSGRLDRHNLVCSCGICRDQKYRDAPRNRAQALADELAAWDETA